LRPDPGLAAVLEQSTSSPAELDKCNVVDIDLGGAAFKLIET